MKKTQDNLLKIPNHIAIIMDGNGRWAKARGLPRLLGHRQGVKRLKETIKEAKGLGVKVLTVFAFSTENWSRPAKEISVLFSYIKNFLKKYALEMREQGVRFKIIGRRDRLPKDVVSSIVEAEELTGSSQDFIFNVAVDYGGRWDILTAAEKISRMYKDGELTAKLTEEDFKKQLCLGDVCDPDLLIRTSGEQRISNFLLWDLAYAEFYFSSAHWPDFNKRELIKAIEAYSNRQRKFGAVL